MKMKKITVILFLLSLSSALLAQPGWLNEQTRAAEFPNSLFFTGFVDDEVRPGETQATAIARLKKDAQAQIAEAIRVQVSSETEIRSTSVKVHDREQFNSFFESAVKTTATIELTGVKTDSYTDDSKGIIYAFACVKRSDLADFYRKQINVDLNKVETAVGVSEQLVAAGKKMSAHRKIAEAKETLTGTVSYCSILAAVSPGADESDLQIERGSNLLRTVERLLIDLEQSTFVYMVCNYELKGDKNDAFTNDPDIICDIIKQALSENECSITDNRDEADYELTLTASTVQRSEGAIISYYANVKGTLYNRLTKKKTVDFSILNDPAVYSAGKTPEIAATKAFKLPALKNMILEKIVPKIKN